MSREGSQTSARGAALSAEDVAALLRSATEDPSFSASDWCGKHGVPPEAVAALTDYVDKDGLTVESLLMLAIRLGYDARRRKEPKGTVDNESLNPLFIVQFVVVDTFDGSIIEGPDSRLDWVFAVADTRNEMARKDETARQRGS